MWSVTTSTAKWTPINSHERLCLFSCTSVCLVLPVKVKQEGQTSKKVTIIWSAIWDSITFVDAFSDIPSHNSIVSMSLTWACSMFVRTHSSYSQLTWVMHCLHNFLNCSINAKVLIDKLFVMLCIHIPVCNEWEFKKKLAWKVRAPGMLCNMEAEITHITSIAVASTWSTISLG